MDGHAFDEGMTMLQMASREKISPSVLRFYFSYLNEKAGPTNKQFLRAVDMMIRKGGLRLPSLGDMLKVVQSVIYEDQSKEEASSRRQEWESLKKNRSDDTQRFLDEILKPLLKKWKEREND